MKELASWVILVAIAISLFAVITDNYLKYDFERSPNSGICYEVRSELNSFLLSWSNSMSPVDNSFCDEVE